MPASSDPPLPAGTPPGSANLRQTGARKLEARPGEAVQLASDFSEAAGIERGEHPTGLMEPVGENQERTRSADGRNPPGSFGTEADRLVDTAGQSPETAPRETARRPD